LIQNVVKRKLSPGGGEGEKVQADGMKEDKQNGAVSD